MYLSTDAVLDDSDKPIESVYFSTGLGPSQSSTATLPRGAIDAEPGTYYLIINADHNYRVTETDESNNMLVIPDFVITPGDVDFAFTSFSTDKSSYPRSSLVKINFVLANLGSTNTGNIVYIRLALSTDNVLDEYDYHFNDVGVELNGPDNFTPAYLQPLALPVGAVGNYYILAKVDDDVFNNEKFAETNESNNMAIVPINITHSVGADLIIARTSVLSVDSRSWQANIDVQNIGTISTSGYKIGAQLITEGSTPKEYSYFESSFIFDNALEAGEGRYHAGLDFSIPNAKPGIYYAAYKINPNREVSETQYDNNVFIDYDNQIVVPPPPVYAVTFNSLILPEVVNDTDSQVNIELNLTNAGDIKGFNQRYNVVIRNALNTIVHSQQSTVLINFDPDQTVSRLITLNLPSPLSVGTYQVTVTCASPVYTSPSSSVSTLTVTPTQHTLTGTMKGEDGLPLTKGDLFLYQNDGSGIRFIQKVTPYTGPVFTFYIDNNPHTLYFIPDPTVHPEYVPTIYGTSLSLVPENFFTTSTNMNVEFEVLRVSQLAAGTGIINGQLTSADESASGRIKSNGRPTNEGISSLPVVLLSASKQPVQITYTDGEGFYEFMNLPRDEYEIVICFELDSHQFDPFPVDIREKNMSVSFSVSQEGVSPTATRLYLVQNLTLEGFSAYQYGDAPVIINSQSDSEFPILYTSSDPKIAEILDGSIKINGVGTVIITAQQNGDEFYSPVSVERLLTINKADQFVSVSPIRRLTYGDGPLMLEGVSSSDLDVHFSSSDPNIASVENGVLTIHRAGTVDIVAVQSGNELYNPSAPVLQQVMIEKAAQTILFNELADLTSDFGFFELSAIANSGLQISFESSNDDVISIEGNIATIYREGVVLITAHQSGNENYHPAVPVTRVVNVNLVLSSEADLIRMVYPNPTSNVVFITIPDIRKVEVTDLTGRTYRDVEFDGSIINLSGLESGMYLVRLTYGAQSRTVKIIKR